ncbi:DDB1- and CUL4-associated factor 4 [Polyrhizophydium stewartii]|uniref:DDB1- and CUL4-associated factor 4 n=1 Tax=Polyrhizophydium stewartii TaxID=2732419 RepID=A0ABR4MWJ9_9FUNG
MEEADTGAAAAATGTIRSQSSLDTDGSRSDGSPSGGPHGQQQQAPPQIPGHYWDPDKRRYFRIVLAKNATESSRQFTRSAIRDRTSEQSNQRAALHLRARTLQRAHRASRQQAHSAYSSLPLLLADRDMGMRFSECRTFEAMFSYLRRRSQLRMADIETPPSSGGQTTQPRQDLLASAQQNTALRPLPVQADAADGELPATQGPAPLAGIAHFGYNALSGSLALAKLDGTVRIVQTEMNDQDEIVLNTRRRPRLIGRHQSVISSLLFDRFGDSQIVAVSTLGTQLSSGELCIYHSPLQADDADESGSAETFREERFKPRKTVAMWSSAQGITYVLRDWHRFNTTAHFLSMPSRSDVLAVEFDSETPELLYNATRAGGIYAYDLRNYSGMRPAAQMIPPPSPNVGVTSMVSVGTQLLAASLDGEIRLWDTRAAHQPLATLSGASNASRAVTVQAIHGAIALAATDDGWFRTWSLRTGGLLGAWQTGMPTGLASCARWDGSVGVWVSDAQGLSHYTSLA